MHVTAPVVNPECTWNMSLALICSNKQPKIHGHVLAPKVAAQIAGHILLSKQYTAMYLGDYYSSSRRQVMWSTLGGCQWIPPNSTLCNGRRAECISLRPVSYIAQQFLCASVRLL